jgi:hypothetical protein
LIEHIVVGAAAAVFVVNLVMAVRRFRAERQLFAAIVVMQELVRFSLHRSELPLWRAWARSLGIVRIEVKWRCFDVEFDPTEGVPTDVSSAFAQRREEER